jgi:hypothetical protein
MFQETGQNPTQAPAAPPDDEATRLRRENKWSYELVTLVLIILAVAIYFILSGGLGRSNNNDLDGEINQPIISPNNINGSAGTGNLD